jgi:hypothetical protein
MTIKNSYIDITFDLTKQKQLVFGLLAAERFINCYKLFNSHEDFGNVICMLESMRIIENIILNENIDSDLVKSYIELVDKNIPDMDDFGSGGSSLALNLGVIIYESLSLIENNEERKLSDISAVCTDSIDLLILEIEEYDQKDFKAIASHDLMKEEIELQKGIIRYLERIPDTDAGDIESLRLMQGERKFDLLNLEEILYS